MPPSDHKNVKQTQAVLTKAKLVFREYSRLPLNFDFSVKTTCRLDYLLLKNLLRVLHGAVARGAMPPKLFC